MRDAPCATAVADALCHGHERDYALVAWCVMPNHVHVVVRLHEGTALGRLVKAWKSVSARRINTVRQRQGAVWARDYYDRFIRDAEHLANAVRYAEHNPVAAGLTSSADRWRWSSAWRG